MLASGDAGQLESWFEYYRLEPFGDEQLTISRGFARLCNTVKEMAYMFIPKSQLTSDQLFRDDFLVMKLRKKRETKPERMAADVRKIESMEPI